MSGSAASTDDRVLVLAARKTDGDLALAVLRGAGISVELSHDATELCAQLAAGAGAVLLAEEALSAGSLEDLLKVLHAQPPWSDLPFVILTSGGRTTAHSLHRSKLLERLGHITLLERPIRTVTLIASVRAALAARSRQYEVRNQLAELVRQREELTRSNAALEQFAYAAAHDLQEPIRNVSLYTQLLAQIYREGSPQDVEDHMRLIVEGATRMQNLVEDLLAYTRAANAPEHLRDLQADAEAALQQVRITMRAAIEQNQARLTNDALPKVAVYMHHIVQLFQNLISNALKYRSHCPPQIHVAAQLDGSSWHFTVRDNGIGIAPEFQDRIFGVFKRLHGRDIPGNGIGLAICQRIVHHYRGRIWVVSTPGDGSEFHFTLPVLTSTNEPTARDSDSGR